MSVKLTSLLRQGCRRQHGAALMVMLVILVIGAAAILVGVLSSSSLQIERDKTTADALAQARNALIGRAVSDANLPGSLPCPDSTGNGSADTFSGSDCPNYIGRLPYKTLGLPDLRDGSGEELWYALSPNFRDQTPTPHVINSDTLGTLTISGTTTANNVIAIVFAPGATLSGQSRSTTQTAGCTHLKNSPVVANSLCPTNYLDGSNNILSTGSSPNSTYQAAAASSAFNDQLIYITHDQLLQPVETRIAREVKNCLDAYAASSSGRYPWAASDGDMTYTGSFNTVFGRIAATPLTTTQAIDNTGLTMLTALSNLQVALNAYSANNNASTRAALLSAGQALFNAAYNADHNSGTFQSYNSITDPSEYAGNNAQSLANGSGSSVSQIQGEIDSSNTALNSNGFVDGTMSNIWPSGCFSFSSGYWSNWVNEVFFQVARANSPGQNSCGSSCLTITGSGNPAPQNNDYRAAVIIGRANNGSGSAISDPPSYYLEGGNLHYSSRTPYTSPAISTAFVTYNPSDTANYSTVNDLVLCLDGNNYCK
jgi:type II secretory pathway pseudopilin PulG